jgi:hypothetical protein
VQIKDIVAKAEAMIRVRGSFDVGFACVVLAYAICCVTFKEPKSTGALAGLQP